MLRKRFLSLTCALVLCLGLLPVTALAAEGPVYGTIQVGGKELTNSANASVVYATTDATTGTVTTEGATAENYNVMWDGSTLTLRNATIQQAEEYSDKNNEKIAVYRASGDLNLALMGENTVDALGGGRAASCGINLGNGSLTISGEGDASLLVFGGPTTNGNSCGIYANGTITIDSGTVNVTGASAAGSSYGINTPNSVTINGGTVTAVGGKAGGNSYGIYTANNSTSITVNGGTVTAMSGEAEEDSCGIFAEHENNECSVTINGGTVTATAGNAVGYGWYSCGIRVEGSITINNGTVNATGKTSGNRNSGIYARSSVTINGGTVTATAGNIAGNGGVYSIGIFTDGGDVIISGGDVTGIGSTGPQSIGIATNNKLEVTGGTVKAEGGTALTHFSCGLYAAQTCSIEDSTVTATGGTTEQGNSGGIFAGDTTSAQAIQVTIKNATVTATGGTATNGKSSGIFASNANGINVQVTIEDATVTATGDTAGTGSYGILAETTGTTADVTINGNSVVRANMTGVEGVDGKTIGGKTIERENGIVFENGVGTVYGNVELQDDLTVAADESLTIPQGATLTIPDSTTLTNYGTMTNNGTIDNKGTLTIEPGGNLAGDVTGNPAIYKVTGVTLNRSNLSLTAGGNAWLRAAVQPDNAANQSVTWASSDPSVATVDQNGVVTAVGAGTATITVTTADGGFTATCAVTVRPDIPPANPNYRITVEATQGGTVTADPTAAKAGTTVTLTPVPDRGYQVGSVAVTDRFGDAVAVTEQADGTYTFTMPNGQVTVTVTFAEAPLPFPDVAEGDWFYDAVRCAYENGLMDGVGEGLFAPNSETTRAQLVTILYRLAGEPEPGGDSGFSDVAAGTWYTDAVAWAAENGIVNGTTDTTFAPGEDITREQLVTVLYRYAESKGYDVSASADLSGYPDAGQVQDYAQPAMAWAVAEGIVEGVDGTLNPAGNATRAQIATILMRFCEGIQP